MKRKRYFVVLCFVLILCTSCQNTQNLQTNTFTTTDPITSCPISENNDWEYYCKYLLERNLPYNNIYDEQVKNMLLLSNIDKELFSSDKKLFNGSNVQSNLFFRYTQIWKEEMVYSADKLKSILNEKDRTTFETTQSAWQTEIDNFQNFKKNLFGTNNEYNTLTSRVDSVKASQNIYFKYRDRTLLIKYIHFEIEKGLKKENKNFNYSSYESLKFSYK